MRKVNGALSLFLFIYICYKFTKILINVFNLLETSLFYLNVKYMVTWPILLIN